MDERAGAPAAPAVGRLHAPEVVVLPDAAAVGREAAHRVAALVRGRPAARLALPTGRTPLPMYAELVRLAREGLDLSQVTLLLLDEFLGLGPGDPRSLYAHVEQHLLRHLPVRPTVHALDGRAPDPAAECARYEALWAEGVDLVVLGVGLNGHLAFNEPGSPLDGRTRLVALDARTRQQYAAQFGGDPAAVPTHALTVGLGTLLQARAILVLATGESKRAVVAAALQSPPDPGLPASALRLHPHVAWLLDPAAAAGLPGAASPAR